MDPKKVNKRPPPLPSFGNSKISQPQKDDELQKKLNSFFTQIQQTTLKQTQTKNSDVESKKPEIQEKIQIIPPPANTTLVDKKKLTLANINSKLNTMLTSKKINLNIGASKSTDNAKPAVSNPQKIQVKRSQIPTQYDPNIPNSFDLSKKYYTQKFIQLAHSSDQEQKNQSKKIINTTGIGMQKMVEQAQQQNNVVQPPQQQQALQEKQEIALRMMQKFGYKVGTGLGKQSQGITTPLTIKKTTDTSCIIQQSSINLNQIIKPQISAKNALRANGVTMTEVIVFVNLVSMKQLSQQVQNQLKQQCTNSGQIKNWVVYLLKNNEGKQELRIFVQYENKESAFNAFLKLNNRYYNQSLASVRFYPKQQFEKYKLDLKLHPHVET